MKYAIKFDEKKKEEKVHSDFITFVKSMFVVADLVGFVLYPR